MILAALRGREREMLAVGNNGEGREGKGVLCMVPERNVMEEMLEEIALFDISHLPTFLLFIPGVRASSVPCKQNTFFQPRGG